ncbi:GNAT family N-acetyltransferase [Methylocystis bryophila]|nr:GNAT family N-acetyltransferase [Methylocystis bryophila]BDV39981.1 hypothetical protein DSM21852_32340 [Methylocystis bryophila]
MQFHHDLCGPSGGASAAGESIFEIVTDEAGFLALEPEWEKLRAQLHEPRFSQSFRWFHSGWETTGRPRGRRLFILVARVNGRVVLIWPLAIRRERLFWTVAAPLGPEWTDYDPGLVEDSPGTIERLRGAWRFLRINCPADVILVQHCREGEPLQDVIGSDATPGAASTDLSTYVSWERFQDWTSYWNARSRKWRAEVGRRSRRFAELGDVTFGIVEDQAEFESLLAWSLAHKTAWMARTGLDNDFMRTAEFPVFLREIGAAPLTREGFVMFALKLDGRPVATRFGALDAFRYEDFFEVHDPEFAHYSLGSFALVECLKWCRERGLVYDFRIGAEPHKLIWATGDRPLITYRLARGPWGRVLLWVNAALEEARVAKDRARTSIPAEYRRGVKRALAEWKSRLFRFRRS